MHKAVVPVGSTATLAMRLVLVVLACTIAAAVAVVSAASRIRHAVFLAASLQRTGWSGRSAVVKSRGNVWDGEEIGGCAQLSRFLRRRRVLNLCPKQTPYGDPDYNQDLAVDLVQKLNMSSVGITRADVMACAEDWVAKGMSSFLVF